VVGVPVVFFVWRTEQSRNGRLAISLFLVVLGIMFQIAKTVVGEGMSGFCDLKHDVKGNGSCISSFFSFVLGIVMQMAKTFGSRWWLFLQFAT
jgi:hypothetical protein